MGKYILTRGKNEEYEMVKLRRITKRLQNERNGKGTGLSQGQISFLVRLILNQMVLWAH